jgi:hypothetical protein
MSVIPIVMYCLLAAVFIFGLTFHDEILNERQRKKKKTPAPLIVINGGKRHLAKPHSRL